MIVQSVSFLLGLTSLTVTIYYWFWAIISIVKKTYVEKNGNFNCRFAICIPAHNEAKVIQQTIAQLQNIDYCQDLYDIYVIADNCTDNTAELSRGCGVVCLERFDRTNKGKGFALEWGIRQVHSGGGKYDAFVIVDADCYLESNSLRTFSQHLQSGENVLQCNFEITNCDENPMTYLATLGNYIENSLFYSPKSRVGAPVFLQGTGMVLSEGILARFPWTAYSNAEDLEYSLHLLKHAIQTTFVHEVCVCTKTPSTSQQLEIQRSRWASGTIKLGRTQGILLIVDGIRSGNIRLVDAGFSIIFASRPILLLLTVLALLAGGASVWIRPGGFTNFLCVIGILSLFLQILYYAFGAIKMGLTIKRIIFCFCGVGVAFKLIVISCIGAGLRRGSEWRRTPR